MSSAPASDATVRLVRDINMQKDSQASSRPTGMVRVGEKTFFKTAGFPTGEALWVTDGTKDGTKQLANFAALFSSSSFGAASGTANRQGFLNTLYFAADDGVHGVELWKSDGTPGGTVLVKDIFLGSSGSNADNMAVANGALFFSADDGAYGTELWKSDGTETGTVMVKDMRPGIGRGGSRPSGDGRGDYGPLGSSPSQMTAVDDTMFFTAIDGTNGMALWKSDGTTTGTLVIKDISPPSVRSVGSFVNLNGSLLFHLDDAIHGSELWRSDGTESGTRMVKEIYPESFGSSPANLTVLNGILLFTATHSATGNELWKSDGTEAGTLLVKDIRAGSASSQIASPTVVNGTLFFTANDGISGTALWRSDGTVEGTRMVKAVTSRFPVNLTDVNGTLFFTANFSPLSVTRGNQLWRSTGTEAGTVLLKDFTTSRTDAGELMGLGSILLFAASDGVHGTELWRSDGTTNGTVMLKDIFDYTLGTEFGESLFVGQTLFFTANDGVHGMELWRTDGTAEGTMLLKDIRPGNDLVLRSEVGNFAALNGSLYFFANDGVRGRELWTSDGTPVGTVLVKDIQTGFSGSVGNELLSLNGHLYFSANGELWKSDGTAAGTVLVKDIRPGSLSSGPWNFAVASGILYFSADDGTNGRELWRSDGTAAGTFMVKNIWAGNGSSQPEKLIDVDGRLFFTAQNAGGSAGGPWLWRSDGTEAGTVLVKQVSVFNSLSRWASVNGTLFFAGHTIPTGFELWRSDGTEAGTAMVKDILSGLNTSSPDQFATMGGALFFTATDGLHGMELWRSDGTEAGTVIVKDIYVSFGNLSSAPGNLVNVMGTLYFSARSDGDAGNHLWTSDGTEAGTVKITDVSQGFVGPHPTILNFGNGKLFFSAIRPDVGRELFSLDLQREQRPSLVIQALTAQGPVLRIFGTADRSYELQTSIDLLNWTGIARTNLATSPLSLTDSHSPLVPIRFYRLLEIRSPN